MYHFWCTLRPNQPLLVYYRDFTHWPNRTVTPKRKAWSQVSDPAGSELRPRPALTALFALCVLDVLPRWAIHRAKVAFWGWQSHPMAVIFFKGFWTEYKSENWSFDSSSNNGQRLIASSAQTVHPFAALQAFQVQSVCFRIQQIDQWCMGPHPLIRQCRQSVNDLKLVQ